jgi:hypothetical protein
MAKKIDAGSSRFIIKNGRLRGQIKPSVVVRSAEGSLTGRRITSRGSAQAQAAVSKMLGDKPDRDTPVR